MSESTEQFESRKQDHIRIALSKEAQAEGRSGLERIQLVHEALPEIDFEEISITSDFFGKKVAAPYFISSMTAGHRDGVKINVQLARAAAARHWPMGVGSQRRELADRGAVAEWTALRREAPRAVLIGNLGLAQVIRAQVSDIQRLIDGLEADAFFIHCNALQECLQNEGNPQFKGGLKAIEQIAKNVSVPVIVKETGCGFNRETLNRLNETGIAAVDVAGLGGTHWGRVEGYRSEKGHLLYEAAQTFSDWGISTVQSVIWAKDSFAGGTAKRANRCQIWASGGVRHGLDAAKLLALGAERIGMAQPLLAAVTQGEKELDTLMTRLEFELKVALFCTGHKHFSDWKTKKVWRWNLIEG